ncbi:methyl-accepting chemotaxis protein [Oceanospirillum multiglobuliferum]|uniref:Methyl-accepting transducer domain-containing protein n=1 Tax=Oceanospirillum multiglobuliferum TaxID=64969 RepID=A0A1T4SGZ7_9GAMM|nr:methyl-accepting chemotaxis protein [Oceanospirillum multiglobuliferum]OPX54244.1 hypothetical protein BTE48_15205 [Oceanospirillum multiglobuliferum]SKA27457.1 methyl-accepting chemotaxis protein [Oceanospirillum multiglobuliferum]
MFTHLRLAQQLALGFGLLIFFSIAIALSAYYGLSQSNEGFRKYRAFVDDTTIASQLQSKALMQNSDALSYLNQPELETLQRYQAQSEALNTLLAQAKTQVQNATRSDLVSKTEQATKQFQDAFQEVTSEIRHRKLMIQQVFIPAGQTMRELMTSLIENAYLSGDSDFTFYAASTQEHLLLGRLYANQYLISSDLIDYQRAIKELNEILPNALGLLIGALDGEEAELIQQFRAAHKTYLQQLALIHDSVKKVDEVTARDITQLNNTITNLTEQIKQEVLNEQQRLGPALQSTLEQLTLLIMSLSVVGIMVGVVLALYLVSIIKRPIGGEPTEIAAITQTIAKGNLSLDTHTHHEKATGILASVIQMATELKRIITDISRSGQQLKQTAESTSAVATQTHQVVGQQQLRIEQIAAAATEMAASIQEVVGHSESSSQASETGLRFAQEGQQAVIETLSAISELAQDVEQSVQLILSLEASSANIGSVTEVIKNISEQTNLLALNAAIEAARAGDNGRGFAVVADEVRQLAQRSQDSTQTIQQMITKLQADINLAVAAMQASRDKAHLTVERSERTGQALETIVQAIQQISAMNSQVASALVQQSEVAEEISANIEIVTQLSEQTVSGAKDTAQASAGLLSIAQNMAVSVGYFRL